MTRQHLIVTAVVTLLCAGILVLFTEIEQPLLQHGASISTPGPGGPSGR